jgi:glycosyltransferase involved in cell wall biosynthesis
MTERSRGLKIALLSINDPQDKRSWSGTTYYLGDSLKRNVGEVHFLGPVKFPFLMEKLLRGVAKFNRFFFRSNYVTKYSVLQNRYASWWLKRKMKYGRYDCIVAPAAAPELAYFSTDIPVIYIGDATYRQISNFNYSEFDNLNRLSRWEGELLERKALKKCSLLLLSSEWAAESAIKDYHVPGNKVEVLTMGANMDFTPGREVIFEKEKNEILTLLYLAVDWKRKGGAIAFDTLKQLKAKGIKARLIVCGCIPPDHFTDPDMEVIPFLNKNIPEDHDRFNSLLTTSHFMILPTRADCSLMVGAEASAFGMPSITTEVGGVPDVIRHGENGYCLHLEAGGKEYADLIQKIFDDKKWYHQLIQNSRQSFEERLNWDIWAEKFNQIYNKHFGERNASARVAILEEKTSKASAKQQVPSGSWMAAANVRQEP